VSGTVVVRSALVVTTEGIQRKLALSFRFSH
jgi:hypothetical protein